MTGRKYKRQWTAELTVKVNMKKSLYFSCFVFGGTHFDTNCICLILKVVMQLSNCNVEEW